MSDPLPLLSLEEKVRLLTGAAPFVLHPLPVAGLRPLVMSDGPAGVRGGEGETAASFPSPTALAATWDEDVAARLGEVFAQEARRHGVDVVLAPVVNMQRTPVGGRHFECYSEDPLLTARTGAALIRAMQASGVGACVKHFAANDSETLRTEYVAVVGERAMREVYLAPFEAAVEAGVWAVMAAYNGLDDGEETATATEHRRLLTGLLKEEWGFDGVVVSDWLAARSTVPTALAGLDLVMPGPGGPWEDALVAAVRDGSVPEALIDDKARRILRLAERVGARGEAAPGVPVTGVRDFLRELAARSTVVLKDDRRALPVGGVRSIALIGPNAVDAFTQGGGSAHVRPDLTVTPLDGLRAAFPDATITVHRGCDARPHPPRLDLKGRSTDPESGEPGLRLDLLDDDGRRVSSAVHATGDGWWYVPDGVTAARLTARVTLGEPGEHHLELGTVGAHTVHIGGIEAGGATAIAGPEVLLDSSVNAPPGTGLTVTGPATVDVIAELQIVDAVAYGRFARAELRHRPPGPTDDEEIAAAATAARDADLAVVIVGTNDQVESEGWDRATLDLPGRQDDLVRAVLAADPGAVIAVNAGAPVLLPWLAEAATALWTWFPGQECGHALADVLTGRTEPAGRLPWTLPARPEDVPVPNAIPDGGRVHYPEGVHIGHRGWLRAGREPALPFGHGLGWTDWDYTDLTIDDGEELTAAVTVRNTGPRAGRETVQLYLEAGGGPERPVRWLAGYTTVEAAPGETATATVPIAPRALQIWDAGSRAWTTPPGRYRLRAGRSVTDLRLDGHLTRH
ncbi:beta-glucosidase family protein [Actinorhabdospora filicis]|nr:glycoside hydrolase family 3 C-terminal domain-containing protein [Actinorhabdospora filicis]